jgi:poly(hydroxyalkanoate) depolymerase family esterase
MYHNLGSALPISPDSAMTDATRLMQAGRLAEATSLIQRALGGGIPTAPAVQAPAGYSAYQAPAVPPRLQEFLRQLPEHLPHRPDAGGLSTIGTTTPAPALPGTVRTGVHHSAAGSRPYRLYVPSTSAKGTRPLVVMLHGGTQDAATFAGATGMDAVAEEHGMLVVYPEQVTSANPMRYWNWFSDQARTTGEPAIIAGLINELVSTEDADATRVYVAGFSAGAAMAAVLASTHPDLVAAVGIHSGLAAGAAHDMVSALTAMRTPGPVRRLSPPVPAITFHGDADPTVSIANSRCLGDQFGTGTTSEIETGSAAGGRAYTVNRQHQGKSVMLEQWVVHGLGHAWSGGRAGGSYTDPTGPDASEEMVRFFLTHHH